MNKREIEATVRNLPYWLPCPIWMPVDSVRVLVRQAGGWFDCPPDVIVVPRECTIWMSDLYLPCRPDLERTVRKSKFR
jgi:hypothetical protein